MKSSDAAPAMFASNWIRLGFIFATALFCMSIPGSLVEKNTHTFLYGYFSHESLPVKVILSMAIVQPKKVLRPPGEEKLVDKSSNAEHVTSIAINFLKSLGNKRGIKPKKVALQGQRYVVELEIGKNKNAVVQIEVATREIKEYEIQKKEKEASSLGLPLSPKTLIMICGITVVLYVVLEFVNVSAILFGR